MARKRRNRGNRGEHPEGDGANAKHANKRTAVQIANDRLDAARMYCEGKTTAQIALWIAEHRVYTLSVQQVYHDLDHVQKEWHRQATSAIDRQRAIELGKVNRLEQEYWDAWFRSLQELTTRSTEIQPDPAQPEVAAANKKMKRGLRVEQTVGDPRFLLGIQWCVERRCKLLGLDAPEKIDHTLTLRQMAREVAEAEGLNPDEYVAEILEEASHVLALSRGLQ